jgi:hypothetical protein
MKFSHRFPCLNKVTANLQGGIGNQLFTLFAAYFVAVGSSANLVLDKSLNFGRKNAHPDSIDSLEIYFDDNRLIFATKKFRKPALLIWVERLKYKLLHERKGFSLFLRQYRSKVFGYDPKIQLLSPPLTINGYFQTYKYIDNLVSSQGRISMKISNPSIWFETLSREISNCKTSMAIHVRRGDYSDHKFTLGMLEDEFFLSALLSAESFLPIDRVFIFSDSIKSAEELKAKIIGLNCVVVIPPKESAPTESMLLMSKCDIRIISNSTFSWWAGYLGAEQAKVIAPDPWYRNHEEPEFLIPSSWLRVKAIWAD